VVDRVTREQPDQQQIAVPCQFHSQPGMHLHFTAVCHFLWKPCLQKTTISPVTSHSNKLSFPAIWAGDAFTLHPATRRRLSSLRFQKPTTGRFAPLNSFSRRFLRFAK